MEENDGDAKEVNRSRNLKNRQCIDQKIKEKRINTNLKTLHKKP